MFWVQLHNSQEDFKELMEDLAEWRDEADSYIDLIRLDDIRLDILSQYTKVGNGTEKYSPKYAETGRS